jgi:hypothetical protein
MLTTTCDRVTYLAVAFPFLFFPLVLFNRAACVWSVSSCVMRAGLYHDGISSFSFIMYMEARLRPLVYIL